MAVGRVALTMATGTYLHLDALTSGDVPVEGVDLTCLRLPVEEIFHRFFYDREWDISEMSLAEYTVGISNGDDSVVGIPVFPSRLFRHRSIYVRSGQVSTPEDLRGKRVGVPQWTQTAGVYMRAILMHEYGLGLEEMSWYQAGVNQPGRTDKVSYKLPAGVRLTSMPNRSLNELMVNGEIDCILSAHPPVSFEYGDKRVSRLFPDFEVVERAYFERHGFLPIMHLIVVRRQIVDRYPWLLRNLITAFELARDRALSRLVDTTASFLPLQWVAKELDYVERVSGQSVWPYGVSPNRRVLENFIMWAQEQGVLRRAVTIEELFPGSGTEPVRI